MFGQKAALERTAKMKADGQLVYTICACTSELVVDYCPVSNSLCVCDDASSTDVAAKKL